MSNPKAQGVARLYALFVGLYPAAFRAKHAMEMKADFAAEWQRLGGRSGGRLRYGAAVAMDSFVSLCSEWGAAVVGPTWISLGFLVALLGFDGVKNQWSTLSSGLGFTSCYLGVSIGLRSKRKSLAVLGAVAGITVAFVGEYLVGRLVGPSRNSPLSGGLQAVRFVLGYAAILFWLLGVARSAAWSRLIQGGSAKPLARPTARLFWLCAGFLGVIMGGLIYVDFRLWHNGGHVVETLVVISLSTSFTDLWLGPQTRFIRARRSDGPDSRADS